MRLLLKILIFFLLTSSGYTQVKMPYFFDEESNHITKQQFKNLRDYDYNLKYIVENDTAIISRLVRRRYFGKLSAQQLAQVRTIVTDITEIEPQEDQTLILNFFFGEDDCMRLYIRDRSFRKAIKEDPSLIQFFIFQQNFHYRSRHAFEDNKGLIQNIFFPYEIVCGNYVIIKPDGSYYKQLGEYRQSDILLQIKADWPKVDSSQ